MSRHASVLVLCLLTACMRWGPQHTGPSRIATKTDLYRVRVYVRDKGTVELYEAQVRNDSIFGQQSVAAGRFEPIALAMSDIVAGELREFDAGRTVILVLGITVGLVLLVFLAALYSVGGT